jgi:transcription antitermination factor NusG
MITTAQEIEQRFNNNIHFIRPTENYKWYVLFVAVTKEFKIKERILRFANKKIQDVFIPTAMKADRVSKNMNASFSEIIYSGYIFILTDLDSEVCEKILELEDVFCFLGSRKHALPLNLHEDELETMERGIDFSRKVVNDPGCLFSAGDYVKISSGIFKNLKGHIKEVRKNLVMLNLENEIMNRQINITIGFSEIEKVI